MNTKRYLKAIESTARAMGAEVISVDKNKHLKVHMRYNGEKRFVMFPATPGNGNAEKLIAKKIKTFFSGSLAH